MVNFENGKTPVNDVNLNKAQKDLQDQIDMNNIYSNDEIKTGAKWIDGKNIYRKVVTFNSNASPFQYEHGIANIDTIIKYEGYHIRSSDSSTFRPLQAYNSQYPTYYASVDGISKTKIEVFAGDSVKSDLIWNIIIYYTKTTE